MSGLTCLFVFVVKILTALLLRKGRDVSRTQLVAHSVRLLFYMTGCSLRTDLQLTKHVQI